jgi:hypothetical protein
MLERLPEEGSVMVVRCIAEKREVVTPIGVDEQV